MRYRTIALIVSLGAPAISVVTGLAGGLGLALSIVSAAISGTLGILTMTLIWFARRRALKR
jgi:hypothetical protein